MEPIQANVYKEKYMGMDFENILMETFIKENGKMIISMGLGKEFIIVEFIKVRLKIAIKMEKVNIFGIMEIFILYNVKIKKDKDYAFINIHLEINIQDNLKMIKEKDKEFILFQMEIN